MRGTVFQALKAYYTFRWITLVVVRGINSSGWTLVIATAAVSAA